MRNNRSFSSLVSIMVSCLLLFVGTSVTHAEDMSINIVNGVKSAIPIAIVPFGQERPSESLPVNITTIVNLDLARSGHFRTLPKRDLIAEPHHGDDIRFPAWKLLKQDYIVIGNITRKENQYKVDFQLWDINQQKQLLDKAFSGPSDALRGIAHRIADAVYEQITGVPGAFYTRIAYVTAKGTHPDMIYSLVVADADGYHPQVVVRSHEPLLSPAWSPDGKRLAYVSFETGDSAIYIQNLATGTRKKVSSLKGINGAPAFSPDGKKLAVSLSYLGNPEIFIIDLATGKRTRITRNGAIDTEPEWMPDGKSIFFTSDRSGSPQIYQIPVDGGQAERITFNGKYNSNVSVGYKGNQLAMVRGGGNVYRIIVKDRTLGGQEHYVSPGDFDDGPSFAPNGSMLLYAATQGKRGVLYVVSADGRVRQRLVMAHASVRSPAWGPFRSH